MKVSDKPFKKGQPYPSLEWAKGAKKVNDAPIKIGLTSVDPAKKQTVWAVRSSGFVGTDKCPELNYGESLKS